MLAISIYNMSFICQAYSHNNPHQNLHYFANEETEAREIQVFLKVTIKYHSYAISSVCPCLYLNVAYLKAVISVLSQRRGFYASEKKLSSNALFRPNLNHCRSDLFSKIWV